MENKRIKKITSSHWGAFEAIVENGKLVSTNPFKEDPNPNDIPELIPEYGPFICAQIMNFPFFHLGICSDYGSRLDQERVVLQQPLSNRGILRKGDPSLQPIVSSNCLPEMQTRLPQQTYSNLP